jgi:hypothetical protein
VRCPRCGNENPGTNRFCGATLLPAPIPVTQSASTTASRPSASGQAPPPTPIPVNPGPGTTASRTAVRAPEPEPSISGPSFLGLNQPSAPSGAPRRGGLSIDPESAPSSRNLDYLLEDEEPHHGGAGKYLLILIALLLAAGFGYLRWRHQPFPWQISGTHKPSASEPADQADSNSSSQASPNTSATTPPADSGTTAPQGAGSSSPAASPANTNPAPASTPSITPVPDTSATKANPPSAEAKQPPPASDADANSDSSSDDAEDTPTAQPTKPKPATGDTAPKPSAAQRSAGAVAEAQKYLYGKGAKQDCGRGLRLLKPAADRADPKAMVEMGALYSAGLCTPRDLPTAYRWFAMALHKEPDNQSVQDDLQKLWGEMTQPERQLAIKLSQ